MAGKKKFGFFAGVFTPSILTILGVIMYMRLGWVVGNAGLIGTIIIILIAHVIAVTTGLSVSSVATDKKIGAGGIYYVLSRSMGVPIGGSIGIALFIGTAFSIALYLIGFAESFNGYFDLGMTTDDFRITGTIALVSLTALALISTSVALKAQFFILAAIIISLISIFFGTSDFVPQTVNMFAVEGSVPLETVFAIFFPAVTGFTAGIAMSGDLKDPKKSIPVGTLLAIGTGLIVYIGLAVFIAYAIDSETLKNDYNILMKVALFAPAVVAGIWGATLSSALGGILGGPRILQAMSIDKVTWSVFGKGKGKDNEPVNALILAFIIAEGGILIGELDVIARVVSMFYLAAYGFINISYYLESWANPDFQPTFKIKRWIGLVGAVACFGVMFKLDMLAMFGAFAVIGLLYFWIQRKQIKLQSNDVWQSVWSNVVNKGLKKLEAKEVASVNWNPNILLFTGESDTRPKLLEFSKLLSGRTGIVTDFKLVVNDGHSPLSKIQQSRKDVLLEKLGIYGRKIEVDDHYSGIENIASTYGFTGVEPNSVMMNWHRSTKSPERHLKMTEKLINLDYNLLYLDYDEKSHFGKYESLDLWWRETDSNNAEMMLNISRFITQSEEWSKAKIRILFVNHNNADNTLIKTKITNLLSKLRIDAEIVIINNGVEQKSFYKIIELQSAKTNLIILGIPNINPEKQAEYILNTDHLFETVGTTLLVRASKNFNKLDLVFTQEEDLETNESNELKPLVQTKYDEINDIVNGLDRHLFETTQFLAEPTFKTISSSYYQLLNTAKKEFEKTEKLLNNSYSVSNAAHQMQDFISYLISSSEQFRTENLPEIETLFKLGIAKFKLERTTFIRNAPKTVKYTPTNKKIAGIFSSKRKIDWQNIIDNYYKTDITPNAEKAFLDLGIHSYALLNKLSDGIKEHTQLFIEKMSVDKADKETALKELSNSINLLFDDLMLKSVHLKTHATNRLNTLERNVCVEIVENIDNPPFFKELVKKREKVKHKEFSEIESKISEFATDWSRNQNLGHNQLQANINLTNASLSVFIANDMIKSHINLSVIIPQKKEIELFNAAINQVEELLEKNELENYNSTIIDKLVEAIPDIDFNAILESEEEDVLSIATKAPKLVQLISSNSLNDYQNCQNSDVETIDVSLANIENYIVQTLYLTPLQGSLKNLKADFNKNNEALYSFSNMVKYIIDEPVSKEGKEENKKRLENLQQGIATCLDVIVKSKKAFDYDLSVILHNTITDLNIRTIIEGVDSYEKVSSKSVSTSKFQNWYNIKKDNIYGKYKRIYDFVLQRKLDVDNLKFIEKNNQYLSNIEQTNYFLNALSYDESVSDNLSFYYKKLFTGSHLGVVNSTYKANELATIKNTITRIDNGVNGAIMILGESLSGKTYFIKTIENSLLEGNRIYIEPPIKQKFDVNDVHLSFQKIIGKSGTAEAILSQLEPKTILIFDDIEKWWIKAPNGSAAINYLSKLIEKFGSRHYFILSCNIYSFDIIRKSSNLENQLLANIIAPPMSKMEMKEVLINRHKTGGAAIWHNNQLLTESKKIDVLFNDIYNKSEGNIGAALINWIRSINKDDEDNLVIQKSDIIQFPSISNPNWKALLYQFIIHRSLSDAQIERIFEGANWVYATLQELEKSELVYKKTNSTYAINATAKYYVEEWLKDLKILN